jgi:hypothetical protein
LQNAREIRDDKNKGSNDKAKKNDILSHCGALFVSLQLTQEFPDPRHDTLPILNALTWQARSRLSEPIETGTLGQPPPSKRGLIIGVWFTQVNPTFTKLDRN